ncbi:hypothetical protein FQ330_03305 [Agrococcus sediminis]|uniref:Uncharacterized protein n=1 Tax=Agrococcus sediminis TaxID=2599924 RepID=A0A5M8QK20_9MICO|nr:hypothetical protein [Agrococcus sediminis]KAA6436445.1 hypothetical protein FQ330_03305 [Agrococcus sediminis]
MDVKKKTYKDLLDEDTHMNLEAADGSGLIVDQLTAQVVGRVMADYIDGLPDEEDEDEGAERSCLRMFSAEDYDALARRYGTANGSVAIVEHGELLEAVLPPLNITQQIGARFADIRDARYSADLQEALLRGDADVSPSEIAADEHTPVAHLARLAKHKDEFVRQGVASNDSTPSEVLAELTKDESLAVRYFAVLHRDTSYVSLAEVEADVNEVGEIRKAARERLQRTPDEGSATSAA